MLRRRGKLDLSQETHHSTNLTKSEPSRYIHPAAAGKTNAPRALEKLRSFTPFRSDTFSKGWDISNVRAETFETNLFSNF